METAQERIKLKRRSISGHILLNLRAISKAKSFYKSHKANCLCAMRALHRAAGYHLLLDEQAPMPVYVAPNIGAEQCATDKARPCTQPRMKHDHSASSTKFFNR
jgi:hypothetical protein